MRKIFIMGLFALLIMQACKKNDQELIDGKRPEERVSADLEKYRTELVNSPNGWVAYLQTTLVGGAYNFYMTFDKNNLVTMRADYDSDIALESMQSTYRIKQVMAPSIIFDTYNLLHRLQDPNPDSFDGDYAVGYGSDFEFEIREQVGDTLKLVGKKRQTPLILVKATADEKAFYTSDRFSESIEGITDFLTAHPFTYILDPKDSKREIQVSLNPDVRSRSFSLISVKGDEIVTNSGVFSFSQEGVRLNNPVRNGDEVYTDLFWDKVAKKLFLVSAKGQKTELLISDTPILPLGLVLGSVYSTIIVPNATTSPGWSLDFQSRRAAAARAILNGGYNLRLDVMQFSFNTKANTLTINAAIYQGARAFSAAFSYTYVKAADGTYKFTFTDADGNGGLIVAGMAPLLGQRINTDNFTLDYFVSPSGAVLGQFISVEHPDFTFTGALQ